MKAIILSAGQGSRLGHMTDDRPKCLIEFAGRSLLDRQLDTLAANGIDEAVVVTGFRDDQIEAALERRRAAGEGPDVRTIFNPFYKVADNLGSLFIARDEIAGDVLVWNGDTLVSQGLMGRVVGNDCDGICVTIDRKDGYDEDDMKVIADPDGRLRAIGKRISEGVTIWYLRVIHHLAQNGDVWTLDISGEEWGEVDFPEDVERAETLVRRWDEARKAKAA
jgi:choline kinase